VLEADLPCTETALFIGATNVTLDLGGHTISGDGGAGDNGVDNTAGHDDVTIRNGTISNFGDGVEVVGASGGSISRLLVSDHFADGIDTSDTTSMTIRNVTARDNGLRGFDLECVGCLYKDNFADNNFSEGFRLFGEDLTITGNRAELNDLEGFRIDANDSRLEANRSLTNSENGYQIGGQDNTAIDNLAESNFDAGFLVNGSDRTKLKANTSKLNEGVGFNVAGGIDVVLSLNKATENLNGGYLVLNATGPTVKSNVANKNTGVGFLFVLAFEGKVTGNTAKNTRGDLGTTGDGFSISGTETTLFSGNLAENNLKDGFSLTQSDDNDLFGNTAKLNIGDGFFVADTSEDAKLNDNRASRNTSAGFRVDELTTTGTNNRASRNGANCVIVLGAPVRCRG
jgi:parallel beta-helix repeat protein